MLRCARRVVVLVVSLWFYFFSHDPGQLLRPYQSHIAGRRKRVVFRFTQNLSLTLLRAKPRDRRRLPRLTTATYDQTEHQQGHREEKAESFFKRY